MAPTRKKYIFDFECGYYYLLEVSQTQIVPTKKKWLMKKAIFYLLKKVSTKKMFQPCETWYKNLFQPFQPK